MRSGMWRVKLFNSAGEMLADRILPAIQFRQAVQFKYLSSHSIIATPMRNQ